MNYDIYQITNIFVAMKKWTYGDFCFLNVSFFSKIIKSFDYDKIFSGTI